MRVATDNVVVVDRNGNVLPNTPIWIYQRGTDTLASVFRDPVGGPPISLPLMSDDDGYPVNAATGLPAWVESGDYDVSAQDFPRVLHWAAWSGAIASGIDVVIGLGQSNMDNYGSGADPTIDVADASTLMWDWREQVMKQAAVPLVMHDIGPSGLSPLFSFAPWYRAANPARRLLLVGLADGGSGLVYLGDDWNWDPAQVGFGFDFTIAQTQAALAAAGVGARLVAMLWSQGEADGSNGTTGAAYQAKFETLIDGLRAALGVEVPFLIDSMVPESLALGTRPQVDAAQIDVQRSREFTAYVRGPAGYDGGSQQHYTAAGQRLRGRQFFDLLGRAAVNAIGAVPLAPGNLVVAQAGLDLMVSFDFPLARATDFIVRWKPSTSGTWTEIDPDSVATELVIAGVVTPGDSYDVAVKAVNETGESAWTATRTVLTVDFPAQVTGVVTTPQEGAMALVWDALANTTNYLVEYKEHASGTWLSAGYVTTESETVSGLIPGTSYDFRVTGNNPRGLGTASATATATPNPFSPLLDIPGVPAGYRAYSPRKLRAAYAGSAIRVTYKDGVEADIGFDGSGNLDTATLLAGATTHAVAGDKTTKIKTWYDQSGGGRNVTQATVASMPGIVDATGALQADSNGNPEALFSAASSQILTDAAATGGVYSSGAATAAAVARMVGDATTRYLWSASSSASASPRYTLHGQNSAGANRWWEQIRNDANTTLSATSTVSLSDAWDNARHQLSAIDTGLVVRRILDGTEEDRTYARSGTLTLNRFSIGGLVSTGPGSFWNGRLQELVIWDQALDDDALAAIESSQKLYWQTP